MNEEIFRKKSLDKLKSPESLDECIKVTNPGIWLILASTILLLAGVCVWGIFGHIDSTAPAVVRIENGSAVCWITEENSAGVHSGTVVKFADTEAVITQVGEKGEGGYACTLSAASALPDGVYEGKAVLESFSPLSFVLN